MIRRHAMRKIKINFTGFWNDFVPEKNFITDEYSFDERQSSYYLAAAKYLGLAEESLDIDGHDIYAILQVNDIKWVISHEESLPHYKNKNIIIPESLLKQVQSLKNRDLLTIHSVSGETIKYQLEVIGKVDQLSKSIPALYCKNGSSYYCINLIKV